MRLGFFTDLHLRGQTFSSRRDDYPSAMVEKLRWCLDWCVQNCDLTVFGGDLTDTHRLASDSVKEAAIVAFNECLPEGHPFFFTYGQHDLHGHDYESRHESTTSWMMRMLTRLNKQVYELPVHEFLEVEVGGKKVQLAAVPTGFDPSVHSRELAEVAANTSSCDVRMLIVHHLLSDQRADWFVPVDDFIVEHEKKRVVDVVLSGDLHDGFGPCYTKSGALFVNPGSLARTKKTKNDLTRPVQLASLTFEDDRKPSYLAIKVECARPADEVFKQDYPVLENIVLDEEPDGPLQDNDFSNVVERLSAVRSRQVNVWDLLENKAREHGLDESVLAHIMSKRHAT